MATYKADHLKEMIRSVVRQEIKEVVTNVIAEVLSERYLKQLVEVNASRPRGVGRTMHIADGDDQDDEGTPEVLPNPTQGIYRKHPMKHSDSLEDDEPQTTMPEGKQRDEMLSLFFEGTKPLKQIEEQVQEGIPLEKIADEPSDGRRPLTEVWATLAGVKKQPSASPPADASELEKREELRLKRLRESLERPA
jgi:hypothetical protein